MSMPPAGGGAEATREEHVESVSASARSGVETLPRRGVEGHRHPAPEGRGVGPGRQRLGHDALNTRCGGRLKGRPHKPGPNTAPPDTGAYQQKRQRPATAAAHHTRDQANHTDAGSIGSFREPHPHGGSRPVPPEASRRQRCRKARLPAACRNHALHRMRVVAAGLAHRHPCRCREAGPRRRSQDVHDDCHDRADCVERAGCPPATTNPPVLKSPPHPQTRPTFTSDSMNPLARTRSVQITNPVTLMPYR